VENTIYNSRNFPILNFILNSIVCLWISLFFISCTGEIESTEIRETQAAQIEESNITFEGVREVNAVSNTKMEVFFIPAKGGTGGKEKTYLVNITEVALPITLPESVLVKDYRGYFKYTITGLEVGKSYTIGIDVREEESDYVKKTDRKITKTTFENYVSDFVGVTALTNASGPIGSDSIVVRWGTPKIFNSGSETNGNVDYFEITVLDSTKLTPADMNNTSLGAGDGRYIKTVTYDPAIFTATFRGLPSNTKFYVQVRAIHVASQEDVHSPNLRSELNTNYLTITTLNQQFGGLGSFSPDSFIIDSATGKLALSSVGARWAAVDAVFDHYRVYYAAQGVNLDVGSAALPLDCSSAVTKLDGMDAYCKRVDYDRNSTNITGLKKLTDYNFSVVLCLDFTCDSAERIIMATATKKTEPVLASFSGVTSITPSAGADTLGKMLLNFQKVNFNNGYFDGFVIEMSNDSVNYSGSTVISHDYNGDLIVRDFNYLSDTQIAIDNIDYTDSNIPFCFSIYPFLYDADGVRESYPNNIWKCASPDLANAVPSLDDFPGLSLGIVDGTYITLRWFPPQNGVYTHFEVFYRKTAGQFVMSEAIQETTVDFNFTNYERVLFPAEDGASSYIKILDNFAPQVYQFGISTYFAAPSGILRSELNSNVMTCDISAGAGQCAGGN
jgi:hypothetical protein